MPKPVSASFCFCLVARQTDVAGIGGVIPFSYISDRGLEVQW